MPQAASSFGAVACDGWLYVYGGHTANTHSYSTDSVSGQFHRLNLTDHQTWEELPGGPPLQGLNLVTWHGKIYRVGGMSPHNKADQPADVRSVADCACFDPATKTWTALPSLPDPRSSHDLVVVGDKLIVVGGWQLTGDVDDARWLDTAVILDLSADHPQWKSVKQPFERRAFIAASYQDKVYVLGGFETESEPTRRVGIYDPATNTWTTGPELPGTDQNGFGPAACTLDGKLYVSVADGTLYRLDQAGKNWDKVATTTPRIVHRLIPNGAQLLLIGGAAKQKQFNLIEAVTVANASGSTEPALKQR
jgi:N-acetylneuraminic acid mutarotase